MKIVKGLPLNRWWVIIIIAFILVRAVIFITFWQASEDFGGWQNFYRWSQVAPQVFLAAFHEVCDWHPPLYYALTSILLFIFQAQWAIYIAQIILAFLSVVLSYKISRLFFSEKISLIAAFLLAVEPYWAWHNLLLASENLATPLFLAGLYFFFKFLKEPSLKKISWSALFWGLAALTRPNFLLLTLALSFVLLGLFWGRKKLKIPFLPAVDFKSFGRSILVFNLIFFSVLTPWLARNYFVYGRFTLANMISTNPFFYNLPPLIALRENISSEAAYVFVNQKAGQDLGNYIGNQGDCRQYSRAEFNRQLDYYQQETRKYILSNFGLYSGMHLVRALPFYLQSGYFDMWSAYSGEYSKPDISELIMKKDLTGVVRFFADLDLKLIIYCLGVIFWGLSSLALLLSCLYAYSRDKEKFTFFLINFIIVAYSALLISPFVLARYRLPLYPLFFIPLVYLISKGWDYFRAKRLIVKK